MLNYDGCRGVGSIPQTITDFLGDDILYCWMTQRACSQCDRATHSSHWFHPYMEKHYMIIQHRCCFPMLLYWHLYWSDKHRNETYMLYLHQLHARVQYVQSKDQNYDMFLNSLIRLIRSLCNFPYFYASWHPHGPNIKSSNAKARSKEVALWCLKFWQLQRLMYSISTAYSKGTALSTTKKSS